MYHKSIIHWNGNDYIGISQLTVDYISQFLHDLGHHPIKVSQEFLDWLRLALADRDEDAVVEALKVFWLSFQPSQHQRDKPNRNVEEFQKRLIKINPIEAGKYIQRYEPRVNDSIPIPKSLFSIAQLIQTSGEPIGKGEFLVMLMCKNAIVNDHASVYDLTINGKLWHVKAPASHEVGIRFGQARCKTFANSCLYPQLVKIFDNADSWSHQRFFNERKNLLNAGLIDEYGDTIINVAQLQAQLDRDGRRFAIGDAEGVIWYVDNKLIFTSKNDIYCSAIEQSRFILSTMPGRIQFAFDKRFKQAINAEARLTLQDTQMLCRLVKAICFAAKQILAEERKIENERKRKLKFIEKRLAKEARQQQKLSRQRQKQFEKKIAIENREKERLVKRTKLCNKCNVKFIDCSKRNSRKLCDMCSRRS